MKERKYFTKLANVRGRHVFLEVARFQVDWKHYWQQKPPPTLFEKQCFNVNFKTVSAGVCFVTGLYWDPFLSFYSFGN